MASSFSLFAVFLFLAFLQVSVSYGAVYKVGDDTGWTTLGNYDYKGWAATKNFHVGDVINFVYHSDRHNVMVVTQTEYQSCNVTQATPIFTTGNDSITLTSVGHHYYLCGVADHCLKGQKVDINVLVGSSIAPSPSGLVNGSNPTAAVPAPAASSASRVCSSRLVAAFIGVAAMPLLASMLL